MARRAPAVDPIEAAIAAIVPHVASVRDRRDLLEPALSEEPAYHALELDGDPLGFARRLVTELPGPLLTDKVLRRLPVGEEQKRQIEALCRRLRRKRHHSDTLRSPWIRRGAIAGAVVALVVAGWLVLRVTSPGHRAHAQITGDALGPTPKCMRVTTDQVVPTPEPEAPNACGNSRFTFFLHLTPGGYVPLGRSGLYLGRERGEGQLASTPWVETDGGEVKARLFRFDIGTGDYDECKSQNFRTTDDGIAEWNVSDHRCF